MASMDVFKTTPDAFSVTTLTASVNKIAHKPSLLRNMGLFEPKPVPTTEVFIEEKNGVIALVPSTKRGAPGSAHTTAKRKGRNFTIPHKNKVWEVLADDVLNVRAFGSQTELAAVQDLVTQKMGECVDDLDATIEFMEMGALTGVIYDSDGSTTIYDLFSEFGIGQTTVNCLLGTNTTEVRDKLVGAKRTAEEYLGGVMPLGWHCLCDSAWFDKLVSHATVKDAYKYQQGAQLQNDLRDGFTFAGIRFQEYRGSIAGVDFLAASTAILFPLGVPNLFLTHFAPADYIETVGTMGQRFYAKQEAKPFNKGIDGEVQSNPLPICTRPGCLIKLTTN